MNRIRPQSRLGHASRILVLASFAVLPLSLLPGMAAASGGGGGGGGGGGAKRDPQPLYQSGIQNLQAKRFEDAEKDFKKVIAIVPDNAQANLFLGMAQEGQNDLKAASRSYKSAAKADRQLYEARARLGLVDIKLGEAADAKEELEKLEKDAAKCASKCTPEQQTQLKSAIDLLKAGLAGAPAKTSLLVPTPSSAEAEQHYQAAVALINAGRYEDAIASLRNELIASGPSADVLNYLGYANRKLQQYETAQAYYEQALAIEPLHRGANEYLGELYIETGRRDLALAQLAKLQQLCSFGCIEEEELRRWLSVAAR